MAFASTLSVFRLATRVVAGRAAVTQCCGRRRGSGGAGAALPADAKKHRDRLRLQDPLEVGRDLGAVLTRRTSAQLRYACLETYVHLVASTSDADESAPRPERAFPFLVAEE